MKGSLATAGLAAALLLAAAGSAALAENVHVVNAGGGLVSGTVDQAGGVDRIPFRLVEGSLLSIQVKAAKKSPFLPEIVLLGPDRQPEPGFAAAVLTSSTGNAATVKNFLVPSTGPRWLEIRGASNTTGGWQYKGKLKLPKKAAGAGDTASGQGAFTFVAPGDCTATITVAAAKGSAALPAFVEVRDPDDKVVFVSYSSPTKTGFSLKNITLPAAGTHTLRFSTGSDGGWTAKASFKLPKYLKQNLLDSQIVTDPILTAVSPTSGDTSQYIQGTLTVDFGIPGAVIVFAKPGSSATVPQAQTSVSEGSAQFSLNLAPLKSGVYDVEFTNPDGGKAVLAKAFTVSNAPAAPASISPQFGYDSETVTVSVIGARLSASATVTLKKGAETIVGTGVVGGATQISAEFDLLGHTLGLWDVVVAVPDAPEATLPAAFEIRNTPPEVTGFDPANNLDGPVVDGVITGDWFDATPTVLLRKAGQADIPGTSVSLVSSSELQATFDTTGAVRGDWDVVVTNPDAQSGTLTAGFHTYASVASMGDAAKVLAPGGTMQSPPGVAYSATQDQFAVTWMDATGSAWYVYIQRVDASGTPAGSAVAVSTGSTSIRKRDPAVAWDPVNDQYIVTWSQNITLNSGSVTSKHPSYQYLGSGVLSVYAQRYKASDLTAVGANVQVSDHTLSNGWYMDEFPNFRSVPTWDAASKIWVIHWMQEWDTSGTYSKDDFDVLSRTLDPATGSMAGISGVSTGAHHEGEPYTTWDPYANRMALCFNEIDLSSGYHFIKAGGVKIASDSSASLVDPSLAVDSKTGYWILTWTRKPATGNTTVEGLLIDASGSPTAVGSKVTIGTGSGDHRCARPLYNPVAEEALVAWTREESNGDLTVRMRRVQATASGLALVGTEEEASGGSGDEADPAVLYASGDEASVIFWVKTLSFDSTSGGYPGALFTGNWRGAELWFHGYR